MASGHASSSRFSCVPPVVGPVMNVELNTGTDPANSLSAPPIAENCDSRDCDDQVRRILDSAQFSSSRRLSDFLLFAANAAREQRTEVDQYEVAEQVLHRNGDFNPLDDASVRKLASQVRHKLDEYYRTEGEADKIVVSLPRRSYVLRFRLREDTGSHEAGESAGVENAGVSFPPIPSMFPAEETNGELPKEPIEHPAGSPWFPRAAIRFPDSQRPMLLAALLSGAVCLVAGLWIGAGMGFPGLMSLMPGASGAEPGSVVIESRKGDLRGPGADVEPGAVLTAPLLPGDGDVTVKMHFLPQHATQQAGLIVMADADNFVRLGSHFKTRSMLEVGHEANGSYAMRESVYRYDPLGQSGLPLWLSLRRTGDAFQGYISRDGVLWQAYGEVQEPETLRRNLHAGVYAFNGRTDIPSAPARFASLTAGLRFHNRPDGAFLDSNYPGWRLSSDCAEESLASIADEALEIRIPSEELCSVVVRHPLSPGLGPDWSFSVHLDFLSSAGSSAGLYLRGEKSYLRLVRRDLNGGSIMLERNVDRDVSVPDYPGSPPIHLRLSAKNGVVRASYSRDGVHFETIPGGIPVEELGEVRAFGAEMTLSHWLQPGPRPPARFLAIEQHLDELYPLASEAGGPGAR